MTAPAPVVPEREPEFSAKPREIAVYYGTNRAPLVLTVWAYLWLFRWAAAALSATLLAWSVLRRILRPGLRPWATLMLVLGLGLSIWWSGEGIAEALRLREYARRVGRVHSNELLPLSEWPLETGISTVGFHKDHKPGRIERPELKDFTVFEDPNRHVMIRSIEPVERDPFFARLRDELRRPGADEAFVFVHGYNTTFEEAVLRTGQIAFDLGFPGVPICFSWASYGGLESYLPDEEHARVSSMHLRLFLEDIVRRAHPARLHLVVHSMGSRVAYDALRDVGDQSPLRGFHFDEVVLAAPDIGVDEFRASALPKLLGCCAKATLYASDSDVALLASQRVHHVRRAGQAGDSLVVDRMMETIDVTGVTKGHSYIGEDNRVIQDLGELIIRHRRAGERPFLEARTWQPDPSRAALPYWALRKPPP